MISISSLLTFDVYKAYIHKSATGKQLLWVSRICVIFFATVMACVSVIFYKVSCHVSDFHLAAAAPGCLADVKLHCRPTSTSTSSSTHPHLSLSFLYLVDYGMQLTDISLCSFLMATATCGAVPPLAASILWARCSAIAAVTGESLCLHAVMQTTSMQSDCMQP